MSQSLTGLWKELKPLVQIEINKANRNGGATSLAGSPSVGVATHDLYGSAHSGTLDPSQAPWVATDISTAITNHNAASDPHNVYVHISNARTISAVHTFSNGFTSPNSDNTHYLGRAFVGYVGHSNVAALAHRSTANTTSYGFAQDASGASYINAASGQAVSHRINNADVMVMNDARLNPASSILKDLGDYNRKWRTLFAAELYVETLVAQSVLATIGGRIMVAPTVKLIADINSSQTTIDVDYSSLLNGDYIYMATAPGGIAQIEAMKVTSGATSITGGYRYTVTRALDGTPANSWVAGDAMVSLGNAVGKGYIELTSTSTIHNHLGPNITIYTRTATANWNDVKPTVSMGNLRSFVDYSSDEAGFAVGNDLTLTPAGGFKGSTNDRTNGLRMFNTAIKEYSGGTLFLTLDTSGLEFTGVDQSYARVRWLTTGDTAEIGTHLYGDGYKRMDLRSWSGTNSAVRVGAWNSGQTNLPVAYVEVNQASYSSKIALIADVVGIGTASPGYKLDITDRIRLRTGGSGTAGIWLSDSSSNNRSFVGLYSDSASSIVGFYNNGAWPLLADSTGKVGIGTASPDDTLHVVGGIRAKNGSVGFVTLKSGDASNIGYVEWYKASGARVGYMGHGGATNLTLALESSADLTITGGDVTMSADLLVSGVTRLAGGYAGWAEAAEPTTSAVYGYVYIDSADGDLKVKFKNGTVKTLATN